MESEDDLRGQIADLLPFSGVSLERAKLVVPHIPKGALLDYRNKLSDPAVAGGIAHELRLLGELLSRENSDFKCHPFQPSTQCDALLIVKGTEVELEITALVAPAAAQAIRRVCDRVKQHLRDRFPGLFFRVGLSNLWFEFPRRPDGSIDEDALFEACVQDLGRAIDRQGVPDPSWPDEHPGPVSEVAMSGYMECSQVGFSVPGVAPLEQARRKIMGKLEAGQATGSRPWMLAAVLDSWPSPGLLDRPDQDSIIVPAFAADPTLGAIIEVPGTAGSPCRVLWPGSPSGLGDLPPEVKECLLERFDFAYGHPLFES